MKAIKFFIIIALVIFIAVASPAGAMEYHVTTASELQGALSAAGSNGGDDTIYLASGTYYGNFRFVAQEAYALTIMPEAAAEVGSVILDGQKLGYVLLIEGNGLDVDVVTDGLKIQNGNSLEHGGGIYTKQSGVIGSFTITNCFFKNNHAYINGGAGYFDNFNELIIQDSVFDSNSLREGSENNYLGGAIYCRGLVNITNTKFINNIGYKGSAIFHSDEGKSITITNAYFKGNHFNGYGGWGAVTSANATIRETKFIANETAMAGGNLLIESCLFHLNSRVAAPGYSGFGNVLISKSTIKENGTGMRILGSNITISDSNITGNSGKLFEAVSGSNGPSIINLTRCYISDNGILFGGDSGGENTIDEISNCFITNNNGSGIVGQGDSVKLISNVIVNNSGDGISISFSTLNAINNTIAINGGRGMNLSPGGSSITNIYNNIIWGNQATGDGSDIYMSGYGAVSNFFNNIYSSAFAIWDNEGGNQIVDPQFHDSANGDFHVAYTSPANDTGLNTAPDLPETDLDGNQRILNSIVDIGAYEWTNAEKHPADLNGNWVIEQTEFDDYNNAWRTNTEWASTSSMVAMNYLTRAGYLLQNGGAYQSIGVNKPGTWIPNP